jgi:hypothetical protein
MNLQDIGESRTKDRNETLSSFALYMARCVEAMRQTTTLQVTMKHRIGIDDLDRYEDNVLPGCGSAASAGAPGGRQLR